jgi:hypothetical protein
MRVLVQKLVAEIMAPWRRAMRCPLADDLCLAIGAVGLHG